ncbi:MAG: hypothetical protein WEB33_10365 [Bacteroidota bacterium]
MNSRPFFLFLCFLLPYSFGNAQESGDLTGSWKLVPHMSHELGINGNLAVEIRRDAGTATVVQRWGRSLFQVDSITVRLNGSQTLIPGKVPDAIGFVNGYMAAGTFTVRNGVPLVSYDYYLSPTRPESDAVADLQKLAAINRGTPYFLLIHVRESSDIKRVKGILDRLGPEFELVPLDVFLTMAGKNPTFQERFLKR